MSSMDLEGYDEHYAETCRKRRSEEVQSVLVEIKIETFKIETQSKS